MRSRWRAPVWALAVVLRGTLGASVAAAAADPASVAPAVCAVGARARFFPLASTQSHNTTLQDTHGLYRDPSTKLLYVTNQAGGGSPVLRIRPSGDFGGAVEDVVKSGHHLFSAPYGVTRDEGTGNLFVTNGGAKPKVPLVKITPDGAAVAVVISGAGLLTWPTRLAVNR
jgi:DNA-binding beta-propeller fold protein YncE